MKSLTLLEATGQRWRFTVAVAAAVVAGVLFWLSRGLDNELVFWTATAIVFGGFVFACVSIRCPSCRARWMWRAIGERDHREWEGWLLGLDHCPACGFPKSAKPDGQLDVECPRCRQMTAPRAFCEVCGNDLRENRPPVVPPEDPADRSPDD